MARAQIQPVILCGGSGTRLWPLSRPEQPKPFLRLFEGRSLIADTLARVADRGDFLPPIVVAGASHVEALAEEAGADARVVLEPCGRNTAPALAAAALLADRPDRLLLAMPSDHAIRDPAGLVDAVEAAAQLAEQGWLMTFGIRATRPETGYGYIRRGAPLAEGIYEAAEFVEKPDAARARDYVAAGTYDWNGGIFLLRADRYLEELRSHAPDILTHVERALPPAAAGGLRIELDAESFGGAPSVSIDVAVMERARRVGVVPVEIGWSDVGTWEAVYEAEGRDQAGNVIRGPVRAEQARGCYLHSDGPKIVAIDVEDLIVVATAEGVLVTRRGGSQSVKRLLEGEPPKGR